MLRSSRALVWRSLVSHLACLGSDVGKEAQAPHRLPCPSSLLCLSLSAMPTHLHTSHSHNSQFRESYCPILYKPFELAVLSNQSYKVCYRNEYTLPISADLYSFIISFHFTLTQWKVVNVQLMELIELIELTSHIRRLLFNVSKWNCYNVVSWKDNVQFRRNVRGVLTSMTHCTSCSWCYTFITFKFCTLYVLHCHWVLGVTCFYINKWPIQM